MKRFLKLHSQLTSIVDKNMKRFLKPGIVDKNMKRFLKLHSQLTGIVDKNMKRFLKLHSQLTGIVDKNMKRFLSLGKISRELPDIPQTGQIEDESIDLLISCLLPAENRYISSIFRILS